jgi:hypothetical protein
MAKRFSDSIRTTDSGGRKTGMTKRQTVLSLMTIAGYENDSAKFTRLRIENPIGRQAANKAWNRGACKRIAAYPIVTIEPIEPTPPFVQRYTIRVWEETADLWRGTREGGVVFGGPSEFPKYAWKLVEPTQTIGG